MHFPRRPCSAQCWMDSWQNTNVKKKKNMWWEVQRCDTLLTTPLWSRSLNVFVFVIAFVFDETLSNGEHTGFVHWSSRANPVHSKSIWSKSLWRLVRKTQGDRRHQQHGYGLHQVVHFGLHHMHRARPQPPSNFQTSICWFIVRLESEFFHLKPSTSQRHLDVFSNISANKYLINLHAFSCLERVCKKRYIVDENKSIRDGGISPWH